MSTSTVIIYVLIFIVSYLFGSIPWGYLIGKMKGIDIRKVGSGNIGATNVTRSVGKWYGKLCFLLDLLKGFLPVLIISLMLNKQLFEDPYQVGQIIAALAAIVGHMFSIFMGFKGGKGISTMFGVLLGLSPLSFLVAGVVWLVVFVVSRYVSLASIAACAVLPVAATFFSIGKIYYHSIYVLIFLYLMAVLAIIRHTGNIKRLLSGTENRFSKKGDKK